MHNENVTGLGAMARRLSPSTSDEGRQTRSPLVPDKLPRLLPHKGTVPGRSRDSPNWTELVTLQKLVTKQGRERETTGSPVPDSVRPLLEFGSRGSAVQIRITPVCLSCINGS